MLTAQPSHLASTQLAEILHDLGNLADTYFYNGQMDTAIAVMEHGVHLLDLAEALPSDVVGYLLRYGKLAAQYGRHAKLGFAQAEDIAQRAMLMTDAMADPAFSAATLDLIGLVHYYRALDTEPPDFSMASTYFQQALQLIEAVATPPSKTVFDVLFHVGLVYQMTDQLTEASDYFNRAYDIATTSRLRYQQASAARHLGYTAYAHGDLATARQHYSDVVTLHDEIGFKAFQPYSLIALGELCVELGERDHARQYIERAVTLATEMQLQRVVESATQALTRLNAG